MHLSRIGLVVLLSSSTFIAFPPNPAWAESAALAELARAREAYLNADFRAAGAAFEEALREGGLSRTEVAEAHVHIAAVALISRQEGSARRHAALAAALDHDVMIPDGAPDELNDLLQEAIEVLEDREIELEIDSERPLQSGEEALLSAHLDPAPRGMASELSLHCEDAEGEANSENGSPPEVSLSLTVESGPLTCRAVALDVGGFELLTVQRELEIGSERRRSPWLWIGIALGAAAITTIAIVLAVTLQSDDSSVQDLVVEGW